MFHNRLLASAIYWAVRKLIISHFSKESEKLMFKDNKTNEYQKYSCSSYILRMCRGSMLLVIYYLTNIVHRVLPWEIL